SADGEVLKNFLAGKECRSSRRCRRSCNDLAAPRGRALFGDNLLLICCCFLCRSSARIAHVIVRRVVAQAQRFRPFSAEKPHGEREQRDQIECFQKAHWLVNLAFSPRSLALSNHYLQSPANSPPRQWEFHLVPQFCPSYLSLNLIWSQFGGNSACRG